ncbi:hypothetical protein E6H31_00205 [Candidatus Bathyarchaeota archaeon]|nr:MAG: hypothetical protein E6H31_00205 [Candidatus Bathyarchaeota archaeon]
MLFVKPDGGEGGVWPASAESKTGAAAPSKSALKSESASSASATIPPKTKKLTAIKILVFDVLYFVFRFRYAAMISGAKAPTHPEAKITSGSSNFQLLWFRVLVCF